MGDSAWLICFGWQAGDITRKSTQQWEAELAQGQEELNMNMATNANVVEQYNKRKAEVCFLGRIHITRC